MATLPIEAQREAVATLFLSYLGRAPEFEAMEHYTKLFATLLGEQGDSATAEDDAFKALSAQIYTDAVGAGEVPPVGQHFTNEDYANWIYTNVLGRVADEEGLAYWTAQLESGAVEAAELVALIVDAALGDERDAAYLANRTEVAIAYSKWEVSNPAKHGADPELSVQILQFVNEDPATVESALDELDGVAIIGETYILSQGVDTITGTTANDTINALYVTVGGQQTSTLTPFDSIDGGAGIDTLNIHVSGTANVKFPADATVKNVEVVNIYNANDVALDGSLTNAANYAGITDLWQIGAQAAAVTGLEASMVAGFKSSAGGQELSVTAKADATAVNVALDQVSDQASLAVDGKALNTLNITGAVRGADNEPADDLVLDITADAKATTFTLNTEIDVDLALAGAKLNTLDASGSTGDVVLVVCEGEGEGDDLNNLPLLHTVQTGAGDDVVESRYVTTKQQGAAISTGLGDDLIVLATTGNGLTTVDAGEGDDFIFVEKSQGNQLRIDAGAGDDIVVVDGTLQATDFIDGGDGEDTIALELSGALVADHYVVLNKVVTNFETLVLGSADDDEEGTEVFLDASQLSANYTEIQLFHDYAEVTKVGTQSLVTDSDLRAVAAGTTFKAGTDDTEAATLAGTLDITVISQEDDCWGSDITAYADTVNLTVDASEGDVDVWLRGDAKSVNVTLVQELNEEGDAYLGDAWFELSTEYMPSVNSLTLAGEGWATVYNVAGSSLVNVDAVDMRASADDEDFNGLAYLSNNAKAETLKLGAGQDAVALGASTYAAIDTVDGLTLVVRNGEIDVDASDVIAVVSNVEDYDDWEQVLGFKKFTTSQTDLDLALKEAAASDDDSLVFHLGGDTYIYQDIDVEGANLLDAGDTVVKLVGTIDLDHLLLSLNTDWVGADLA